MNAQLTLDVRLQDSASFENFFPQGNEELVQSLEQLVSAIGSRDQFQLVHIWGGRGCGKSHVLQACCHRAQQSSHRFAYFSVGDASRLTAEMLDGLENLDMVCLEDIDAIAGQDPWERALFQVCERMKSGGGLMLVTSQAAPSELGFAMPDLQSRLRAGLTYQMKTLDDAGKRAALQLRAGNRGIELGDEVMEYLLRRYPRDLGILFALLDRIDMASLEKKRRVTIPLLREMEAELKSH